MKLFANLPLKLLALLLGFGVWYALALRNGPPAEEWSLEVPLRIQHDPAFVLTERSHEAVVVHGKGLMPPHGALVYTAVLINPREGKQTLQLSPQSMNPPPGARIISVAPSAVELTFDRLAERSVPIEAPSSLLDEGLKVDFFPKRAKIAGPKRVLAGIRTLVLPPFTLMGTYPQTTMVPLVSPHPQVQVVTPREAVVMVREARP